LCRNKFEQIHKDHLRAEKKLILGLGYNSVTTFMEVNTNDTATDSNVKCMTDITFNDKTQGIGTLLAFFVKENLNQL
jgi:hypothetical protein